ncbi:hypothetical protein [Acidovorax sp. FG27]|uniref:hypothetical protein n=1 Tax=Acidovorax sp. FG27 TaxID=3133652 RepID=UPI0030E89A3E
MLQPPATAPDYAAFLDERLPLQAPPIASYPLGDQQVWIKRAGPGIGPWRYRGLALLAGLLRLPALRPVPNPGGTQAVATEVRRLRDFEARGLRAPEVLAARRDGFLMRHLGRPGQDMPSLGNEIHRAVPQGAAPVLALWRLGLDAIARVHGEGTCLSQAFARNLVRDAAGVVAYVDFEDDPAAALPLATCQVRDALCYAHSTAIYLAECGALEDARALWTAWLMQPGRAEGFGAELATTVRRLGWLRHLPQDRRWGRDAQRLRAAYDLMAPQPPAG